MQHLKQNPWENVVTDEGFMRKLIAYRICQLKCFLVKEWHIFPVGNQINQNIDQDKQGKSVNLKIDLVHLNWFK